MGLRNMDIKTIELFGKPDYNVGDVVHVYGTGQIGKIEQVINTRRGYQYLIKKIPGNGRLQVFKTDIVEKLNIEEA